MMRGVLLLAIALLQTQAFAYEWVFSDAIPVTRPGMAGVFYHIESSGRKHIAVSGNTVAVTWEDNRSGSPQIFVAFKDLDSQSFSPAVQISAGQNAYEPSIVGLHVDRFLVAWEQDGHVFARIATQDMLGDPVQVDAKASSQVSLAVTAKGKIYCAWASQNDRYSRIVTSVISVDKYNVRIPAVVPVEAAAPEQDQLYPGLAASGEGIVIAWEDRRHLHTRLYYAYSTDGKQFSPPQSLNQFTPPQNPKYGRGTGVTRVALASDHRNLVAATWMDKRFFQGGYDIYAGVSVDGGRSFGQNELVQDMGGENIPQWHPAIAVHPAGVVAVAWDDNRYDTSDIWFSWREHGGWSDDISPAQASGAGDQTNPAIAIDAKGQLHMVWISRIQNQNAQLLYLSGKMINSN